MDKRTLIQCMKEYDSDEDINSLHGGNYGQNLAEAAYNIYGMRAFSLPRKRESKDFTPIRFPLIRDPISADDEWRRVKAKVLKTIENALNS